MGVLVVGGSGRKAEAMGCSGRKWQGRLREKRKLKLFGKRMARMARMARCVFSLAWQGLTHRGEVYFDSSPFIHSFVWKVSV